MVIVPLSQEDRKSLMQLYREVTLSLNRTGIRQWDWFYPNRFVIGRDMKRGTLFGIRDGQRVIGAVVVDRRQSSRYAPLLWSDRAGEPACIHRLAVHPSYQGQGIGKRLLQFAEQHAQQSGGTSIRLDVYTGNPGAVGMYRRAGYAEIGRISFPMRKVPYLCFEKLL
ncbi:acetyltransferase (GNAT) family protein [Paenibacillus taihuensis]|uniref:Acetyltransferase (GNAT) family protein n=1 Tax=Paenibacillus taihuensis TaxID=1156355 RepID=A0A3D9RNZ4_9BACL|nr:GNAT family N-acetyltransferase [Paenibacillus taihuensis]REE81527.1 acetyltransferase (GNAT) family protein [Paenibacillus taihuensis]